MCAFLLNTTQPLAPMMAELRYLSYFMENSLSHVKLACFGRYSSSNTRVCLLTIPKLDCIGCALQGFMKGEAKGTRLTGSARQLPVFSFWGSPRWCHLWPLCTTFHCLAISLQTLAFSKIHTISWKTSSLLFSFWKMLLAVTSYIQYFAVL